MSGTVRGSIIAALDNLRKDDLSRFKHELSHQKHIGYGFIENATTVEIAQKIIDKYTTVNAIACVADVLRAIEHEATAKSLEGQGATAAAGGLPPHGEAGGSEASVCSGQMKDEHFVDKNQVELIRRIKAVKPILDHLRQKRFMSGEMYDLINAEGTNEDKMRKLLHDVIEPLGLSGKDELVRILNHEQPYIMEMLRGK